MSQKFINGKAYDWSSIDVQIPGLNIETQEISYNDELEKEVVYGKGSMSRGYGTGNYKAEGKISLLKEDYDDLIDYCKAKRMPLYKLLIPKIVVSYANEAAPIKIDELKNVTFTKADHKGAQGDKSLKVDLDMIIVSGITRDGLAAI